VKILFAPNSFKETLAAAQAARAMAAGAIRFDRGLECDICPVADGGDGTMDALIDNLGGKIYRASVTGPLGSPVEARFAVSDEDQSAIIELAEASGLALVPPAQRDPMRTTTFGTGQLIPLAIERGCRSILLCIGGSATIDGGTGIAQALGAKFFDHSGQLIPPPITGGQLMTIARVRKPVGLPAIRVACDVNNPLYGPSGATAVYGPQKGATPAQVRDLDQALQHLAALVGGDANMPGAGSAGGAGFGLVNICGAKLERGIDVVLNAIDFQSRCAGAALVLTGEGRLDEQSLHGKACMGVAAAAARLGVPTIAIVGSTGPGVEHCIDPARGGMLRRYFSMSERFGMTRAISEPEALLAALTEEVVRAELS